MILRQQEQVNLLGTKATDPSQITTLTDLTSTQLAQIIMHLNHKNSMLENKIENIEQNILALNQGKINENTGYSSHFTSPIIHNCQWTR